MNVNCIKIGGHIGFANLTSFHQWTFVDFLYVILGTLKNKTVVIFCFSCNLFEVDPKI